MHPRINSDEDMSGGFWIEREKHGASIWWYAAQLDEPGGYVVNGRRKQFSYRRDAIAQIEAWRTEG